VASASEAVTVAGRRIGLGAPCFVIAEIGVNHNGDVGLAHQLVDTAADAGVDAVKFQTWITDSVVAASAPLAGYQAANLGDTGLDQRRMLAQLELSRSDFEELQRHADARDVLFLSTPDEEESSDFLESLGVPMFKIGSGEVTNLPYLRHLGRKRKPVILSTGMATLDEVGRALDVLREAGTSDVVLLHCVSLYPAPPEDANLRAMQTMRDAFGVPVGFSDHTMGRDVAVAAVALGACVLEKHVTLSRDMDGPDHRASLEPGELAELVAAVRDVESALGDGDKRPVAAELETRAVVRRRIIASRALAAGTVIEADDVKLLRAAVGLEAELLDDLIGRRALRDIDTDEPITAEAVE
jgi:N-acetylneuraminate synthase/N,N'-diacetyllegionaminate synthase